MNRWTRMGLLTAAAAALAGASVEGCVTGDIPARTSDTPDGGGSSSSSGSGGGQGDDAGASSGSSGASSGSSGASSGSSSSGASSGSGSSGASSGSSGASSGSSGASSSGSGGAGDAGTDAGSSSGSDSGSGSSGGSDGGDGGAYVGPIVILPDGGTAPCLKAVPDFYVIRGDNTAIIEPTNAVGTPVVDQSTALALRGIVDVAPGAYHGCALLQDGSVECWQTNASAGNTLGQLGNGTLTPGATTYRSTPVLTAVNAPLTGVAALGAGANSTNALSTTCAITMGGEMWCWGDLSWTVGNGSAVHSPYAQAITTNGTDHLTGVIQGSYGTWNACALVQGSPNTVWCWGYNAAGELAQGTTTSSQYPVQVHGLTNPTKVVVANASGADDTICVLDGQNVKCWGHGSAITGQNVAVQTPTPIVNQSGAILDGVIDLVSGTTAFSTRRTDNRLWHWGSGFTAYASDYGLPNVTGLGYAGGYGGNGPRFMTSDGVYHNGMTNVTVSCSQLQ